MPNLMSVDLDAVALDDRVGEHFVSDLGRKLSRGGRLRGLQVELEILPLAYVLDVPVAERVQRLGDGPPLRVEDRRFQCDENARAHGVPRRRSTQNSLSTQRA